MLFVPGNKRAGIQRSQENDRDHPWNVRERQKGLHPSKTRTFQTSSVDVGFLVYKFPSLQELDTLLIRHANSNTDKLVTLVNKSPTWNEQTQSYVLNFHGRVTQASIKNFQIIHPDNGTMSLTFWFFLPNKNNQPPFYRWLHRDAVWPCSRGRLLHGLQLPFVCPAGLRHHPLFLWWQAGLWVSHTAVPDDRRSHYQTREYVKLLSVILPQTLV